MLLARQGKVGLFLPIQQKKNSPGYKKTSPQRSPDDLVAGEGFEPSTFGL